MSSARTLFLAMNRQLGPPVASSPDLSDVGTYALPPWIYPPPEAEPIDLINYVALPAIGASATIVTQMIESGYNAVIRAYGNNFVGGGWTEGSGSVTWQIAIDSAPVPGYDLIPASLGSPANPVTHPSGFRVLEGQTVTLIVTNVSVVLAGQLSGGRLLGYYYPKEYDDASRGSQP
jgi:hypothetical protein